MTGNLIMMLMSKPMLLLLLFFAAHMLLSLSHSRLSLSPVSVYDVSAPSSSLSLSVCSLSQDLT